jgi:hypothetical protein
MSPTCLRSRRFETLAEYYSKNAPASTLLQVGKLAREELMIQLPRSFAEWRDREQSI